VQPHTPSFGFTATGQGPASSGPAGAVPSRALGGPDQLGGAATAASPQAGAAPQHKTPHGGDLTVHVEALLALRDGEAVRRYRARLDDETARRVINDPRIPKERRGALSLAKAFAGNPRYGETSKIIPVDSTPEQG